MKRITTSLLIAALVATPMLALPPRADAHVDIGIGISVGVPPPALPVYAQPIAPGPGYMWTPGYWAWDPAFGYYWVPGTWVMPPQIGLLWTPGWWGWSAGYYRWNPGYWGSRVGFYGGVNYGYGYFGSGYSGGYWRGNNFFYNRAVNNINVTNIRNVYVDRTVINNVNRVSYNGGRGGLTAQPTAAQRGFANQRRYQATARQTEQRQAASRDPAQRFSTNQGRPAVFATQQAGRFDGRHAVRTAMGNGGAMVAAPDRARGNPGNVTANRGFVQAPRDRVRTTPGNASGARFTATPDRAQRLVEAPRNAQRPAAAAGRPQRFVEAPRDVREPRQASGGPQRFAEAPRNAQRDMQAPGTYAAPRGYRGGSYPEQARTPYQPRPPQNARAESHAPQAPADNGRSERARERRDGGHNR